MCSPFTYKAVQIVRLSFVQILAYPDNYIMNLILILIYEY